MTRNETRTKVEHGIKDQKGRSIGGLVIIRVWSVEEIDALPTRASLKGGSGSYVEDSRIAEIRANPYQVWIHATRNGKTFGASPSGTFHPSEAAAELHASRKLAEQAKRYSKQFGRREFVVEAGGTVQRFTDDTDQG